MFGLVKFDSGLIQRKIENLAKTSPLKLTTHIGPKIKKIRN